VRKGRCHIWCICSISSSIWWEVRNDKEHFPSSIPSITNMWKIEFSSGA